MGSNNKTKKLKRICPLYCKGIGNEIHYLTDYKNEKMKKGQSEFLKPFHRICKGAENVTKEEFCKALLLVRMMTYYMKVGTLCRKITLCRDI